MHSPNTHEVHRKKKFYAARGVAAEILDSRSLEEAEPNLRKGLAGGLLVPHDSVIYPPWAAQFLVNGALECGAHLRLGQAAVKVRREGVCLSDGSQISAGFVINCAGAWSPSLTAGISVQKRKGHLLITDRYPGFLHHQLVELGYLKSAGSVTADSVAFNIQPRKNGQLLIGSSRQYGSEDSKIDSALLGKMLQRAVEYMPALGQLSAIRAWTGFRAATPDKLPLIGPYSEQETLYLATGHEGLGITTSLGTAKLLVDQLLQRNSAIPAEPYMPNRSSQEVVYA